MDVFYRSLLIEIIIVFCYKHNRANLREVTIMANHEKLSFE